MPAESRVPTSEAAASKIGVGWSLETTIDYLLAVMNEKHEHLLTLISANDRRYEQRFAASQQAMDVGFAAAKTAVDAALAAQREAIQTALAAQDRAVNKAELATEKRFESVNEFRGTLDNQQRTLISRSEVQVMREGLEDKILNVQKVLDGFQARQRERAAEGVGIKGGYGYAVGIVGFVLTLLSLVLLILRYFGTAP